MDTSHCMLAASGSAVGMIAVVVGGLIIAAALVWAVRLGVRVRRDEPRGPGRRGAHPTGPEAGPVHEGRQMREPDEVPRSEDGERLGPHDLTSGSRRSDDQSRPRWDPGSSGSFGSGGSGGR
jgi:hypothetical protein